MGKVVEKKKKGRPSLLDLQKRRLQQEQEQQQQQQLQKRNSKPNPNFRNSIIPNSNRRPTRRNPNHNEISEAPERIDAVEDNGDEDEDDDDDDEENGKRKEKKLKFVLRLPSQNEFQSPSYLNSGSYLSDSNLEDGNGENPLKKRKINAVGDGSAHVDAEKDEKHNPTSKATYNHLGTHLESGPTTPLPDKKLLFFILDRLQKKDTYSVFSEPVDPEELPDYHEIIQNPMDFGTVRKKLDAGAYANLEQFERDVFLICSNAMEYNAPDTIYFRQARSIQELAKKNFENLRQDSEGNEAQPRIVRRGRPPKNLKKPLGRPPLERAGSEFSSDAALATGGDNAMWSNSYNLRKGPVSVSTDAPGRTYHGARYSEASWSAEHKSERNDEFPGLTFKGMSMKLGKKQFVLDENRRNTYKHFHQSNGGCEPSVFTTFDGEKKQLMAVGLHAEYGYARSLARFAANLGPVAWEIASKKILRTLPAGMSFGPGWVGEKEAPPVQMPLLMSSPPQPLQPQKPVSFPRISSSATTAQMVELKGDKLVEKQEPLDKLASDVHLNRSFPSTAPSSSTFANKAAEPTTERQITARGPNSESGYGLMNSSSSAIMPPPFQIHQSPVVLNPALNGITGGFGFNLAAQMTKLVRPAWQTGNFSSDASVHSRMLDAVSGSNNVVHSVPTNRYDSEEQKPTGNTSTMNSSKSLSNSRHDAQANSGGIIQQLQPNWRGSSLQQKPDSVPPDLNVRFQLPGSPTPSSSVRVDSPQPDLALQL
ncbi:Bromodomain [Macleaya cordata]|uniref:Bromodomain n=1 Tax=Macleaya cordata TaxID=56857 RepID=A0A200PR06_MACCD|nr:Bromodomain [Macleaya cordata]